MIHTDITLNAYGYRALISSTRGGICYSLCHLPTGADILRTPKDEEHLAENVFLFGNPPLFPPNRIRTGKFTFEGREYTLPLNEPQTGCHIHGALYEKRFSIAEQSDDHVCLVYQAEANEYIGFPHAFRFCRSYTLQPDGLHEDTEVTNLSNQNMPFYLAYHTTFNIPFLAGTAPKDHRVQLQVGREEMRTEQFIPTGIFREEGAREKAFQSGEYVPCGTHLSAFYESSGEMRLRDIRNGISIVYDASAQFTYRMLFQPADGSFFVCEPQSAAIDCFHLPPTPSNYGLISLAPGQTKRFDTRIGIEC